MIHHVKLINPYDRDDPVYLYVDGKQIGWASYDEHASSGQELLIELGRDLGRMPGFTFEEVHVDDAEV